MKLLIAVKSCRTDLEAGFHQAILDTWGKDLPADIDLRFLYGLYDDDFLTFNPPIGDDPTIAIACLDSYLKLPQKTKAILDWSWRHDYNYTYLCDTDTYCIPKKLLTCGFNKYDYSGRIGTKHPIGTTFHYQDAHQEVADCHPWASGGVGYFVSRRLAGIVRNRTPNHWAEDLWVGQVAGPLIQSGELTGADLPDLECSAAWHFPRRKYHEKYSLKFNWMAEMYKEFR